jgi:hypothetical protein
MSIYKVPGCNGEIHVGSLPSGDVTVRGYGDDAAISLARTVAGRHYGVWNAPYQNWIVSRSNSISMANDLASSCKTVA